MKIILISRNFLKKGALYNYRQKKRNKKKYKDLYMSLIRVLLCILFPPLAVLDKGCGSILIVVILTICGWVPGAIAALVVCSNNSD